MEYTLDAWIELWQRELNYGSIDDRLRRAEKWNGYYTFLAGKTRQEAFQKTDE